eukprot:tig00000912_g5453.t1
MCASARRPKMRLRSPGAPRRSPLRRMPRGTLVEGAWRDSATRSSSRHCSKATSAACPPVQLSLRGVLRRTPGAADRMEVRTPGVARLASSGGRACPPGASACKRSVRARQ